MTILGRFGRWIGNGLSSLGARLTGSRLTGAEREANAFSAQQAQLARDYETEMSNTSYQRGVADMQAAGVNPALMYGQGAAGASVPNSPSPTSVNPQDSEGPMGMLNLIMSVATWKKDIERKGLENDLLRERIGNLSANTEVQHITVDKMAQDIKESKSRVDQNTEYAKVLQRQQKILDNEIKYASGTSEANIAMMMAKAGLDKQQQKNAGQIYAQILKENSWIDRKNAAIVANYLAGAAKSRKETSLMAFSMMKTVTVSQARSMGLNVGKFFGANGSWNDETLLLIVPNENDKEHPWTIVGIDYSGEEKSKEEPEKEPEKVDTPYGNLDAHGMSAAGQ